MTLLRRLASVLRWIVGRDASERDLNTELDTFIDMAAEDKISRGIPVAEARRLAVLELGGVEQIKERVRTERHGARLDEAGRDLRYALRTFRRNPGFVSAVVVTLALGIGANTAIFTLIDALMLRSLAVPDPQQLRQLSMRLPGETGDGGDSFSVAIVRALADQKQIFGSLAGFSGTTFTVRSGDSAARIPGAIVSGGYYDMLELTPAAGRLLTTADDEPGAALGAVISDGYWERQFARSPTAVGQTLQLNGTAVPIVGVSPRGFSGANVGSAADVTMTLTAAGRIDPTVVELGSPGNFWLRVLARRASGVSAAQADAQLAAWWRRAAGSLIPAHWPPSRREAFAGATFRLAPGGTGWTPMRGMYRAPLLVLLAMVGVVLLIACANVSGLMLTRAATRQREMAVRLAIGAGRARIVRQLLIESALLSSIGASLGVVLGFAGSAYLVRAISKGPFQVAFDLTPNVHLLTFTGVVAVVTTLLFGLAPALQTSSPALVAGLTSGGRVAGSRSRWLSALVSAQVALSLMLLVGAGLFARTLRNLQSIDPGFNREGVVILDLVERRTAVPAEVLEAVRGVPGVVSASLSTHTPLSGSVWSDIAVPKGQPLPETDTAYFIGASSQFFSTMQTPIVEGREFTERDVAGTLPVAVINEAFARRFFPGRQPVGEVLSASVNRERRDLEIVGVVRDTRAAGLRRDPPPAVYMPYRQVPGRLPTAIAVRIAGPIGTTASAIVRTMQHYLPDTPIDIHPLSAQVDAVLSRERLMASLAGAFGILALALACVGLYGIQAYSVARQTRELGVRIALGAQRAQVVAGVLLAAMRLVGAGLAIGVPAAWAASRGIQSMLFGLTPSDPATAAAAVVILTGAALMAAYLPARRASLVDPMVALRHE